MPLTVGADPEFFLSNKHRRWTSAHDLVPGTKQKPHKVDKGAIQADGTAVEFNIEPASSAQEFATNLRTVLTQVRTHVPKELKFEFIPSLKYNRKYFKEQVPEEAKVLGCDPDFDAWNNGAMNPRPTPTQGHRTASGHLHFGWTSNADINSREHIEDCMLVVRRLDYYFRPISGVWETYKDTERRNLYGKWGCFRPKPYGVEYRTLGNSWLKYPNLWPWMFEYSQHAFQSLEFGIAEHNLPQRVVNLHSIPLPIHRQIIQGANTDIRRLMPAGAPQIPLNALDQVLEI